MKRFSKFFSRIIAGFNWFLWVVPFLFFFIGYYALSFYSPVSTVKVPALIGKTVAQGLELLAQHRLNARMVLCKEDQDLPEGTILTQQPTCGDNIRVGQTVFITSSKKPEKKKLEDIRGLTQDSCKKKLEDAHFEYQQIDVVTSGSEHRCLGFSVLQKNGFVYIGKKNSLYIVPDCKNWSVVEVIDTLGLYQITVQVLHAKPVDQLHTCHNCIITEQKPLAGSFILLDEFKNLKKVPVVLQVKVENY